MQSNQPTVRRILFSALAALTVGLGAASLIAGFSDSFPVRLLQGIAIFASGAVIVGGAVVLAMIRLAGWRDPESEIDFEALVQRTERLASEGGWDYTENYDEDEDEDEEDLFDPHNEEDFKVLVRRAIDDLPLEFIARSSTSPWSCQTAGAGRTPTASTKATRWPRTTSTTGS